MLGAIKYGLKNLVNFDGRDARQTFWFFVLAVYILFTAVTMAAMIPSMMNIFAEAFRLGQSGASEAEINAAMVGQTGGMMKSVGMIGVITGVGMILLLAASFVRRLHDTGLSGWWALVPGSIYVYSIAQMPGNIDAMNQTLASSPIATSQNPLALMQAQGSAGLLGWIPIVIVIALGARKSNDGANRFGTEPVRF